MGALRKGLLIGLLLAQLVPAAYVACTQTSRSLENRIPKPDPKKYRSVQDAKDWKNPYLIVRPDGIEILGITPVGRSIPVHSVPRALERLPDSAWPCGLVVAVQDVGIVSENRLVACCYRQLFRARSFWGLLTGPNPTDRAKRGSKRHLICDGHGIPSAIKLTEANCHDSTQLYSCSMTFRPSQGRVVGRVAARTA